MEIIIDMEAVRNGMKQGMAKMGMSSQKLGELTGIPKSTLDKFLDGTTASPAFDRVCAVSRVLNVSIDDLIGIHAKPEQETIIVPPDMTMIERSHQQTIEAKDAHIAEMRGEIDRLRAGNARLTRWHRIFIAENVFLACLTIVDFFVPTFGYFRNLIASKLSSGRILRG